MRLKVYIYTYTLYIAIYIYIHGIFCFLHGFDKLNLHPPGLELHPTIHVDSTSYLHQVGGSELKARSVFRPARWRVSSVSRWVMKWRPLWGRANGSEARSCACGMKATHIALSWRTSRRPTSGVQWMMIDLSENPRRRGTRPEVVGVLRWLHVATLSEG